MFIKGYDVCIAPHYNLKLGLFQYLIAKIGDRLIDSDLATRASLSFALSSLAPQTTKKAVMQ